MEIEIRPLVNADCKAVIDLILPIQQIEFKVPVTLEDQPDLQDIEAYYRSTGGDFWGAFIGDRLAGTIALISTGHQAGTIRKDVCAKGISGQGMGDSTTTASNPYRLL